MGRSRSKRVSEVVLDYRIEDNDADKRAKQLLENIEAQQDAIHVLIADTERWKSEVMQASRAENVMDAAIDDTTRQLRENADALHAGARGAEDYGDAYRRASDEVEAFGDVATNVSQVAGALRGFGAGGVADVALLGADITDAVEGVRRLGPALGDVAGKALNLVNALPGVNLGMGQFVGIIGGIGAAIAGVSIGLEIARTVLAEFEGQVESYLQAQRQINDDLADLSSDNREERIADLQAQLAEEQAIYDRAQQIYDDLGARVGVFYGIVDDLDPRMGEAAAAMDAAQEEILALNLRIHELQGAAGDAAAAANDAAAAEEELAASRAASIQKTIEAARAEDEASARDKYERQLALLDLERDRAKLEEELIDLEVRSNQAKAAARDASAARIDQLETQFATFLANANTQIADANTKAAAQRTKIERDYMQKERKAFESFTRDAARAEEDYNRDRLRRLQDTANDLLAAEEANDVIAFIRAQRAGQEDINRLDEDASTEAKRKAEDFAAEQKERKKEAVQRLLDLRKATQERIKEIRDGISKQRALLQEQIAAERDALQQRLADMNRALELEIYGRRKAFEQSLVEQQQYNQARAALEQQLADRLLAISRTAYGNIISGKTGGTTMPATPSGSTGFTGVGALSGLAAGLSTGLKGFTGSVSGPSTTVVMNGNIGPDLSYTQVQGALNTLAGQITGVLTGAYNKAG